MTKEKGLFIAFEGCEGSGKSTVINEVFNRLLTKGYKVILTREPGGTRISEEIRKIILNPNTPEMEPRTEALLYAAARTQHTLEKIIPALEQGYIVLCDRYIDSSFAYQGHARELGIDNIAAINDFGIDGFRPNLRIFLDVNPEISLKRIKNRKLDRLEQEAIEFHKQVYNGFKNNDKMIAINAAKPLNDVINDTYNLIESAIDYHYNIFNDDEWYKIESSLHK